MAVKSVDFAGKTDSHKRREHEDRTGCCTNMGQLGWRPMRWSKAGEPVEFGKMVNLQKIDGRAGYSDIRIVRTHGKLWRMEKDIGFRIQLGNGASTTSKIKLDTPLLPGPVAMAIWFEVENSNGSVRFR